MSRLDRFGRRLAAGALVFSSALAAASGAAAAPLRLPDHPYRYTVIDQDLAAALQEFGANLAIKVSISPEVRGRIQGRIPDGTPQAFLDRLAAIYNLEWYYDGSVLFITSAKENRTQVLVLNPVGFDAFAAALDALRISDPRFPLHATPGKGVALVSGPPRYVALVEQALGGLVAEAQANPAPTPVIPSVTLSPPVRRSLLTVYRGSGTTFLRDGRPE